MFLLTIIIWGIFEIYLPSIIFRPKNVAKVQQIFQLCKFFAKKIYQQFLKVIQNKIVNRSFTAFYNFYNVEKFSKNFSYIAHFQYFTFFINRKSCPKRKIVDNYTSPLSENLLSFGLVFFISHRNPPVLYTTYIILYQIYN